MARRAVDGSASANVRGPHRSLHWLDGVVVVVCSVLSLYTGLPQCLWGGNPSTASLLLFSLAGLYITWRLLTCYSDCASRCAQMAIRDFKGLVLLIKLRWSMGRAFRRNLPIHHHFLAQLNAHPDKEAVAEVDTGKSLTFRQFNCQANRYANYFLVNRSVKKGEVVALFLENGIDFFSLWVGLSKLGVITAWINSHLKMEPLLHSLRVSHAKAVVTSTRLLPTLMTAISHSKAAADEFDILLVDREDQRQGAVKIVSLASRLDNESGGGEEEEPEVEVNERPNFQDVLCYIYTSGTTGQPKAAIIKHCRFYFMTMGCRYAFGIWPHDRLYVHMPMYHSAGGVLGVGQMLVTGCSVVIRRKFSASAFWSDCTRFHCTVSQYIGEIARYLLAQPYRPEEQAHQVRVMYGNGMRPEIWGAFVQRYGVKRIGEFYGSTEGTSNILNVDNHTGSCGFMPTYAYFLTSFYPIQLIKVHEESGEPLRDPHSGLCIRCRPGDIGEMVGLLKDDAMLRFEGYVDKEETGKKMIRDVIHKGDRAFASGDILHWNQLGYLYFVDRRGDTFRWRGENVSTTQVEGIVQPMMAIVDASVYGVVVRGREGRAGMLAVSLAEGTNDQECLREISRLLADNLPVYAIPVFLRICREIDRTGTFKLKKAVLQKEGYDTDKCQGDQLFYWDSTTKSYSPLTKTMQVDIDEGRYNRI